VVPLFLCFFISCLAGSWICNCKINGIGTCYNCKSLLHAFFNIVKLGLGTCYIHERGYYTAARKRHGPLAFTSAFSFKDTKNISFHKLYEQYTTDNFCFSPKESMHTTLMAASGIKQWSGPVRMQSFLIDLHQFLKNCGIK